VVSPKIVTADDFLVGIEYHIPSPHFAALSNGTCSAYYQVKKSTAILGISSSAVASVEAGVTPPADLDMHLTMGAAVYDPDTIKVDPINRGVLKGKPGVSVTLALENIGTSFVETNDTVYQTILSEDGRAYFGVRSTTIGSINVTAYESDHADIMVDKQTIFSPYAAGIGNILFINHTTSAPADGETPCSIYLKTAGSSREEITMVSVTVGGNAIIDGYNSQTAEILLNSDKSAEIDIINTFPEDISVELSLPESSGSINRINMTFIDF
jgi:hypothetical protein